MTVLSTYSCWHKVGSLESNFQGQEYDFNIIAISSEKIYFR